MAPGLYPLLGEASKTSDWEGLNTTPQSGDPTEEGAMDRHMSTETLPVKTNMTNTR